MKVHEDFRNDDWGWWGYQNELSDGKMYKAPVANEEAQIAWDKGVALAKAAQGRMRRAVPDDDFIRDDEWKATKPEFETAVDFINKAAEYVGGSRAKTHGDKGVNFRTTGALHAGLDEACVLAEVRLDPPLKFALQMILAKMSRIISGGYNPDDFVDIAGYAGCAGEIAAQLDNKVDEALSSANDTT